MEFILFAFSPSLMIFSVVRYKGLSGRDRSLLGVKVEQIVMDGWE